MTVFGLFLLTQKRGGINNCSIGLQLLFFCCLLKAIIGIKAAPEQLSGLKQLLSIQANLSKNPRVLIEKGKTVDLISQSLSFSRYEQRIYMHTPRQECLQIAQSKIHIASAVNLCIFAEAVEKLSAMNHPDGDRPLFPDDEQHEALPFMKLMSCFRCIHRLLDQRSKMRRSPFIKFQRISIDRNLRPY
ncbi:hypothetical protein SADUNF_Sadunf14G0030200 [Salix dunnii]|uniref:Uncharacterized protein n=1 Tax=Salix dunnii TaxID=1413687 RepID=A0A835JHQ5_9ROSI|nr:hypothetical protein SADUNF_Sadunf14G0030200 [Salix dunnii]